MKNYIEIKNKSLRLSLIWIGISINIAFFIWFFISGNIDPAPRFQVMNQGWRFLTTLTFWTTQVCAMNIIFPILVVLNGKWGIWKPRYQSWISFMAFNLMCMIIFWTGFTDFDVDSILEEKTPVGDISAYSNIIFSRPNKLIITLWAHMFAPLASVIVFVFFVEKYRIDFKSYYRAASPFCIAYLSSWFLINIIKMFVMYLVGVDNIITDIAGDYNDEFRAFYERIRSVNPGFWGDMSVIGFLSGPYFFFNFALDQGIASNGMSLMMGIGFGSVIITILMQYMVLGFANLWVRRSPETETSTEYDFIIEKYEGKWLEIVKICFYAITLSVGIYQLTQVDKYINEDIGFMYKAVYLVVAILIVFGSIAGTLIAFLYIFNISKNPSWTFFLGLLVGGFALSFFLIGFPLMIISVFSLWYKAKK